MFDRHRPTAAPEGEQHRNPRRLQDRNIAEEDVPPRARAVWASVNEQVGMIAVLVHNMVVSPVTGQPWNNRTQADIAAPAFAKGLAMAQQEASDLSSPDDEEYLLRANQADQHADLCGTLIEDTNKIVDDTVEYPPGSRGSGREAIAKHRADRALAGEREVVGDSWHQKAEIERYWIIIVAVVLAALDVMLLWRPLLNLGWITSAGALYKWVLAFAFAGAQALYIDLAIHGYRERERENRELRDAIKDHNRAARGGLIRRDLTAVTQPPPPVRDLPTVDEQLRTAYRWLLATAIGVGAIGVFRVAFLSRGSGQSIVEATLFGAFVGMVLGALVLLLGVFACRGNRLGDRLRAGAAVVVDIENRVQEGARQVGEARDAARIELTAAEAARARAEDTREWVLGQYWQALLLAAGWLGMAKPLLDQTELVAPRKLSIANSATGQVQKVTDKLKMTDRWLTADGLVASIEPAATPDATPATPGTALELHSATTLVGPTGRLVAAPRAGESGRLVRVGTEVEPPPTEPRWLLAVAAAAAVVLALVAAVIAPTPDDVAFTALARHAVSVTTMSLGALGSGQADAVEPS